jgi:alpha-L-glutamate ligase-like protein
VTPARAWLSRLLFGPGEAVLGMNRRNVEFILARNPRRAFQIADDKLLAKSVLAEAGVPVAPTLDTFRGFFELGEIGPRLAAHESFAIKPARGHGGFGILIAAERDQDRIITPGGRRLGPDELRKHVADIVFGVFSLDHADVALVEPRLMPSPFFAELSELGLSDVRIIMCDETPALAMIRVPTRASDGKANLHQGALGVAVRIDDGRVVRAQLRGVEVDRHPDSGAPLLGRTVPGWSDMLEICRTAARALPLKYLGMDLVVDRDRGPLVLEINVRPGLEIQNVNRVGLRGRLRELGIR